VLAAALAVAGVAVSVSGRLDGSALVLLPVALALAAGAGSAAQAGVNGRVNVVSGQVLSTTWLNFTMGTLMLGVVAVARWGVGGLHPSVPHDVPWWAWWGGLCGIGFIGTAAWAVRHLGVLLFSLAVVTGQLGAAVVLDLLDPATRPDVGPAVLAGVAVTLVAAALAARYARPPGP
jgi:transporter family-2 protein